MELNTKEIIPFPHHAFALFFYRIVLNTGEVRRGLSGSDWGGEGRGVGDNMFCSAEALF